MKTLSTLAVGLTTLVAASGSAFADHRHSLEELACLLRTQAAAVDRELVEDFPGTLQYRQMRAYTLRIDRTATRIEESGRFADPHRIMHEVDDIARDMRIIAALAAEFAPSPTHAMHGHDRVSWTTYYRPAVSAECIARLTVLISNMEATVDEMNFLVRPVAAPPRGGIGHPHDFDGRAPLPTPPAPTAAPRVIGPAIPIARNAPAIRVGNGKYAFTMYLK